MRRPGTFRRLWKPTMRTCSWRLTTRIRIGSASMRTGCGRGDRSGKRLFDRSAEFHALGADVILGEHVGLLPGGKSLGMPQILEELVGGQHRSEEHTSELQSPCNLVC